jgi:hypothetical protein
MEMSSMILNAGDRLLVAHRRLFADDQPRFFIGVVEGYESGVVMASGYSWVRDPFSGDYQRSADRRTKVFSLVSGSVILYRLPDSCDAERAEVVQVGDHGLVVRDPDGFEMDLSERRPRAA